MLFVNVAIGQVSVMCEDRGHDIDHMGRGERREEGDQRTIRNIYLGPNQDCYNEGDINWEINYGQLHPTRLFARLVKSFVPQN